MMPKRESPGVRSQLDKFKDAARELECDDDEKRFEKRLGKLVKVRPDDEKDGPTNE